MNATIAEFILRHAADATELAQRAKLLAALTQLSPQRRNELAEAVDTVCRTIAAHGGKGKVRFSLVQHGGERFIEVSVCDQPEDAAARESQEAQQPRVHGFQDWERAVMQRVGKLVDHFESSGWPVSGAVIRMAQALSPAFPLPSEAEVADWAQILKSNTTLDALAYALRRARSLETALGSARCREQLRSGLGGSSSETEHFTMLSLVISKTKNAITILEPDGTIIGVNDAFVQMTGYSPAEAAQQRLSDLLFGPSTDPSSKLAYHSALEKGDELTQDIMQYRKDGHTFWVESDLIPVRNAESLLTRWIVIQTDITRRRQTEEALRAAKETAEKNSRLKSEFLANLSHEIRTPMNAIIGMSDLALATDLTADQREYLQTIRSSSEALHDLLNDILDLSKIESGKMELEEVSFSLPGIVQDTIKTLSVNAQRKGLALTADVPDDLPRQLRGDPMKLRQILINLVGNAIKFTEQGAVRVEVESQWRSEEEIGLHFQVHDTGIGIAADKLGEIFEAFRQGDASTTRRFGGSGLGLTISSELVRMMGGQIWVESLEGEGSVFHFTARFQLGYPLALPAAVPAASAPTAPTSHCAPTAMMSRADGWKSAPRVRPLRVLVADDHAANRHLVTSVLHSRGHECIEAVDGQETLAALQGSDFDVILMDVQMPIMDGFQATAAIRKQEESSRRHVPIIALTAHAMSGDRERCLSAGMDAYLAKPLRPGKLVELVESVAELKPAASSKTMNGHQSAESSTEFDLTFALESLDHDKDLLISQMQFLLNDAPILLAEIAAALNNADARRLQLAAHRLKGMLGRYAYRDAVDLALQLEQKGQHDDLPGARPLYEQLIPMVRRLESAIQRYMSQPQ